MRYHSTSKSNLFLIELIIVILFLSISSAVCIRIFVESHTISKQAENLNLAQTKIQNVVSVFQAVKEEEVTEDILIDYFENGKPTENGFYIYYDKEWQECKEKNSLYWIQVTFSENSNFVTMNAQAFSQKEQIYSCTIDKYIAYQIEE